MPKIHDRSRLRAILQRDPGWCVYAIGDLAPGYFERCDWYAAADALALVYRGSSPPVLFLAGDGPSVRDAIGEVPAAEYYLHVRESSLAALRERFRVETKLLWRMVLDAKRLPPEVRESAVRLSHADVPAIERLCADGAASRESPDFFFPEMVALGVFYGIRDGGELAAVAGTHLVAEAEGVAAIGNIYTRSDRRGRGYGSRATAAVVHELVGRRIGVIALNVRQHNEPAIRIYRRLGFEIHCELVEGVARSG